MKSGQSRALCLAGVVVSDVADLQAGMYTTDTNLAPALARLRPLLASLTAALFLRASLKRLPLLLVITVVGAFGIILLLDWLRIRNDVVTWWEAQGASRLVADGEAMHDKPGVITATIQEVDPEGRRVRLDQMVPGSVYSGQVATCTPSSTRRIIANGYIDTYIKHKT